MNRFDEETKRASELARALGPFAKAILVEVPEGRFVVPVEDQYVGWKLRHEGNYNPEELQSVRMHCNPQTRLLVVGAHVGSLAIPLAKNCRSVTAIEANPQSFALLKLNVELNGQSNCRIIHKAVSNKVETIRFVLNRVNSGGSKRMPRVQHPFYFHDNPDVVEVLAEPLDDLLPGESFEIVLMDIEGSEYFALLGMQRILKSTKVLQLEFMPHHLRDIAGVTVAEFLMPIREHFTCLVVAHKRIAVGREQFENVLTSMYDREEGCEGIVFLKVQPESVRFG